jgi:hypothetical protein
LTIFKTPKGVSSRISKIRSQLNAFKKKYGFIDDRGGSRYYLFYLYFLLGDNRRASEFIHWYEKEFPDDIGKPFQLLCWTLILHRMGKDTDYKLAETMLSNIYLIPHLLGDPIQKVDMWHSSNYDEPNIVEYLPEKIRNNISAGDLEWIASKYNSDKFQKVLKRHISIHQKLEKTPIGEFRSHLVREAHSLLDGF